MATEGLSPSRAGRAAASGRGFGVFEFEPAGDGLVMPLVTAFFFSPPDPDHGALPHERFCCDSPKHHAAAGSPLRTVDEIVAA